MKKEQVLFWIVTGMCLTLMAFEAFLYGKGIGHF